jgi:hypothetical protein
MTEKEIGNEIIKTNPMLFRNDCGVGYVGGKKFQVPFSGQFFAEQGDIVVINPKHISYGLHPGSGDFIGWETIIITKEMIGSKIAIFKSIEIKTERDRLKENQINWFNAVKKDGGIAELWKEKNGKLIKEDQL